MTLLEKLKVQFAETEVLRMSAQGRANQLEQQKMKLLGQISAEAVAEVEQAKTDKEAKVDKKAKVENGKAPK